MKQFVLAGIVLLILLVPSPPATRDREAILLVEDFESGTYDPKRYFQTFGGRPDSVVNHTPGGRYAARVGAGVKGGGKLITLLPRAVEDLWMRAWIYFPSGFGENCCPAGTVAGPHLWRYYSSHEGTDPPINLHFDFNLPARTKGVSSMQFAHFANTASEVVFFPGYRPASPENTGRWQCVETRVKLNTPGKSDGVMELWVDDRQIFSADGLNLRGSSSDAYRTVDIQSNLGGNPLPKPLPARYWWAIDDVVLADGKRPGCGPISRRVP